VLTEWFFTFRCFEFFVFFRLFAGHVDQSRYVGSPLVEPFSPSFRVTTLPEIAPRRRGRSTLWLNAVVQKRC
jgi:hypothetical protein